MFFSPVSRPSPKQSPRGGGDCFAHLHCTTPALAGGARERSAVHVSLAMTRIKHTTKVVRKILTSLYTTSRLVFFMTQPPLPSSDESLRAAILASFAADSATASADLRVGVLNGIAHLAGKVDSLEIRDAAERLAKIVSGLRGVVNRIEAPGAPSPARRIDLTEKGE